MLNTLTFQLFSDEIQALLDEIAELRAENLQLIKDATNLDNAIDSNDVGFDGRSQIAKYSIS